MGGLRIIVTADAEHRATAEATGRRLAETWPVSDTPAFTVADIPDLPEIDLDGCDAAVLIADHDSPQAWVLSVLTALEDAGVPVLALLDRMPKAGNPFEFGGALTRCRDESEHTQAATLHALVHRQQEVRRLRQEAQLSLRHHGGLENQITRLHEDLQLAAMVQREFLPRELPSVNGVDVAALWRPAHYVSGDLYDVIRLDEENIGLFIADSIGHGVPAALMTMVICRALTVKEINGNSYRLLPPCEVLDRLNRHLIRRRGRTTRFATAVYAMMNCRTRKLTVAGAGHPPPILLRGTGVTDRIETGGGLLGVFEDEQYDQVEVDLADNDRLVLFSDGFEQAFPDPDGDAYQRRIATERYQREFEAFRESTHPTDMIDLICRRLDDQTGSLHQIDDLTLVCMTAGKKGSDPFSGQASGTAEPSGVLARGRGV